MSSRPEDRAQFLGPLVVGEAVVEFAAPGVVPPEVLEGEPGVRDVFEDAVVETYFRPNCE